MQRVGKSFGRLVAALRTARHESRVREKSYRQSSTETVFW